MILTKKQEEGLRIAVQRYKNREKYTCISGYAGAGKSTLVRYIVAALGVPESDVCYATFTGKAAQVLLKKGNKNVSTLHRLLYEHFPKPDGTFFRKPVEDIPYDIVIVDEVSMAPKSLMQQLFKYNVHVICLGDPFQLPPIDKEEDNGLLYKPHIFLDEVMRQAAESEIIQLTMAIRAQQPIGFYEGKEVIILPKKELVTGMYDWADQILCGTNQTRVDINNQIRGLMGRGAQPEDGDKVICLRNYWDYTADNKDPLVNGTIGYISNVSPSFQKYPKYLSPNKQEIDITNATFISDSGADFDSLPMDTEMILTGKKCVDFRTTYKIEKNKNYQGTLPLEFTYGYAITYWKAQGSEWDNVLVIEEDFPYDKETHARAMYTACTRASKRLVWIKK